MSGWGISTGDGKADLASKHDTQNQIFTYFSSGPYPDLVTDITNPSGGVTTITYKPLTDSSVYTKDPDPPLPQTEYPNMNLQYALYVVSDLVVSDDLGPLYDYHYTYAGA